jgi:hypothetical protein
MLDDIYGLPHHNLKSQISPEPKPNSELLMGIASATTTQNPIL